MLNLFGYRMWYYFESKAADHRMEVMLDKEAYLESDLITIRIPLTLPYQTDTDDFERISGEVSFEGKIYKYVERKMENGHFVLKCLPDYNKMQVEHKKNELVKNSLDQSPNNSNKPGSGSNILKFVSNEYEENIFTLHFPQAASYSNIYALINEAKIFSLHITAPGQPPDALA